MKKKILVLVVVLLLLASTIQVAFAVPPPDDPGNYGSCNMDNAWWDKTGEVFEPDGPDYGPGNPNPKVFNERGMYNVHLGTNPSNDDGSHPQGYTNGATHMDLVTEAHCGPF